MHLPTGKLVDSRAGGQAGTQLLLEIDVRIRPLNFLSRLKKQEQEQLEQLHANKLLTMHGTQFFWRGSKID